MASDDIYSIECDICINVVYILQDVREGVTPKRMPSAEKDEEYPLNR